VLVPAIVLAAVGIATKLLTGWVAGSRTGVGSAGRLRAGAALIARGEFSIIIAGLVGVSVTPAFAPTVAAYVLIMAVVGHWPHASPTHSPDASPTAQQQHAQPHKPLTANNLARVRRPPDRPAEELIACGQIRTTDVVNRPRLLVGLITLPAVYFIRIASRSWLGAGFVGPPRRGGHADGAACAFYRAGMGGQSRRHRAAVDGFPTVFATVMSTDSFS
jgi:hypothetical protein